MGGNDVGCVVKPLEGGFIEGGENCPRFDVGDMVTSSSVISLDRFPSSVLPS